jgi:hypothetical protein
VLGLGAGGAGHRPQGPDPLHADPVAYGRRLALAHGIDPDQPTSFLFLDGGQALEKSAAILALLRGWAALVVASGDRPSCPRLAGRRL